MDWPDSQSGMDLDEWVPTNEFPSYMPELGRREHAHPHKERRILVDVVPPLHRKRHTTLG